MTPQRKYQLSHPEVYRKAASKWYYKNHKANKNKALVSKRKQNYGPDGVLHYRLMFKLQKGRCAICNGKPDGRWKTLCQDHKHKGSNRGLLCNRCNQALGLLKENIETIKSMVKYLRRYNGTP